MQHLQKSHQVTATSVTVTLIDGRFDGVRGVVEPDTGVPLRRSLYQEPNVRVYAHGGIVVLSRVASTSPLEDFITQDADERFGGLYYYNPSGPGVFFVPFRGDASWSLVCCDGDQCKSLKTVTSKDKLVDVFIGPGMPVFLYDSTSQFLDLVQHVLTSPPPPENMNVRLIIRLDPDVQADLGLSGSSIFHVYVYNDQALFKPLGDSVLFVYNDNEEDDSLRFVKTGEIVAVSASSRRLSPQMRVTRSMASKAVATPSEKVGVLQLVPRAFEARERADHDIGALIDRIHGGKALNGALPDTQGRFYAVPSHGFRRNTDKKLWDDWPSHLKFFPVAEVGLQQFVNGEPGGVVPALRVDFTKGESAASVMLRMNCELWGCAGPPSTYSARNGKDEQNGCWGFLVQFEGDPLELLLAIPYTTTGDKVHQPSPVLAVRKSAALRFTIHAQDLSRTPMASLGLHMNVSRT